MVFLYHRNKAEPERRVKSTPQPGLCPQHGRSGSPAKSGPGGKGDPDMTDFELRYVSGHVEVYTRAGCFLFSADTAREAMEELAG